MRRVKGCQKSDEKMLILKKTQEFSEWRDIKIKRKIAKTRKNHATSRYRDI
jgi:hypothetical protein